MMKIPPEAVIPFEKLTNYLLVERIWDDKSRYLGQAGFTLRNPLELEFAIRNLVGRENAIVDGYNEYGVFYRVTGDLVGPKGRSLPVVLVWLQWKCDASHHFVTLKPNKKKS